MTDRRIDVLLPVFNGAATIEGAIDSMLRQTVRELRIVVVDDGSNDGTSDIVARLAKRDPRIVVVTQRNAGIVAALNVGLAICDAPLIARHDADDLAYPERLERQRAFLDAHPEVVAVGCNAHHIAVDGRRLGTTTTFSGPVSGVPSFVPAKEPYLMHPFLLVRRTALTAIGGYRHAFHCEDADLYWRLSDVGSLHNLPDILGEYRIHASSVTGRSIVNGRIAAVESQRAAISEQRRRAGRDDISFPPSALDAFHRAERLAAIVDLAARDLTAVERRYLEIATAAKLLEITSYRPFRPTRDDLATIRRWIREHYGTLSPVERRQLIFRRLLAPSTMRRHPLETLRAMPWSLLPGALWDLVAFVAGRGRTGRAGSSVAGS